MYADRYLYIFIYRTILVDTGTFIDHLSHSITLNGGLTGRSALKILNVGTFCFSVSLVKVINYN